MKNKIVLLFRKHFYLLSGLLIFLSFPTYDIWIFKGFTFFAWISLVPLFVYLRDRSYKDVLLYSFIAGFIGSLLVYSWIGNFGANVEGGYVFLLALLIPCLTAFFITKIIIAEYLSRKFERLRIFIYPSVWILIDWVESIGYLAFPLTYWGYSQYEFDSFIQISSYTGIMGITFILILSNTIVSDFIYKYINNEQGIENIYRMPQYKKLLAFAVIILLITGYGQYIIIKTETPKRRDIRIASVQSCINPWQDWNRNRFVYLENLKFYTDKALEHDPDMIIWSESATLECISYHYRNSNPNRFERTVFDMVKASGKPLLTGEIGIIEDSLSGRRYPQNNAVLIDGNGDVVDSYAKINLVPFGEWFPYDKFFPSLREFRSKFGASDFVPGDRPILLRTLGRDFGALICYEGIFYRLCSTYKDMGADFLVNITNYGWTDTYAGHMQLFAAAKFRAVENGIWFISAGNTGPTASVDPYGRIYDRIPILEKGYMVSDIDFSKNHKTLFSTCGDVVLYSSMLFIFVILVILLSQIIVNIKKSRNK